MIGFLVGFIIGQFFSVYFIDGFSFHEASIVTVQLVLYSFVLNFYKKVSWFE